MKNEALDEGHINGVGVLRKDNNPWRAKKIVLILKMANRGDSVTSK